MNDQARQALFDLIAEHGRSICLEARGCKGLLQDAFRNNHKREFHALVIALEEQVAAELRPGLAGEQWDLVAGRLLRRLTDNWPMDEEIARWAVESWALALGVITVTVPTCAAAPPPRPRPATGAASADVITSLVASLSLKLTPAGEFWMGSPDSDPEASDDEKPRHKVRISRAFYLGITPVTQAQYVAVMGPNPSHFCGPDNPVENVSWFDATQFCNELSCKEGLEPYYVIQDTNQVLVAGGLGYRLPTEAEWECACRAGTDTQYCFDDGVARLGEYAWYNADSGGRAQPVGRKRANNLGLHDMHGNVWEWCWDGFGTNYYRMSPGLDPVGAAGAASRVIRGGSWLNGPRNCRSADRDWITPASRNGILGFRVARGQSG